MGQALPTYIKLLSVGVAHPTGIHEKTSDEPHDDLFFI
jgi:hypothetical protein